MPHREVVRIVPNARVAVLFLHGIVGTPRHFDNRLPLVHLVPEDWSVYSVLLPGHGGSVEDFSNSTMKQWKSYVRKTFYRLANSHEKVIIVGHSMGTLFALQLAVKFPKKVGFLFLLGSAICPWVSLAAIKHCLRLTSGVENRTEAESDMLASGSVTLSKNLLNYIPWIPNMLCLLKEADKTKKIIPNLTVQTIVFQSKNDELVSARSAKYLSENQMVKLTVLQESGHFGYSLDDTRRVQQAFIDACAAMK